MILNLIFRLVGEYFAANTYPFEKQRQHFQCNHNGHQMMNSEHFFAVEKLILAQKKVISTSHTLLRA